MNSFKQNVKEGAALGAIALGGMTADNGNPLLNAAVGAGVGAAVAAVGHVKNRRKVTAPRKSSFYDSVQAHGQTSFAQAADWHKDMR